MIDGVVNVVGADADQVRYGDHSIAFGDQTFQDGGQGFRRMLCCVVEEDDGAGLYLGRDTLRDLLCGNTFPVQTVPAGNYCNMLRCMEKITGHLKVWADAGLQGSHIAGRR